MELFKPCLEGLPFWSDQVSAHVQHGPAEQLQRHHVVARNSMCSVCPVLLALSHFGSFCNQQPIIDVQTNTPVGRTASGWACKMQAEEHTQMREMQG